APGDPGRDMLLALLRRVSESASPRETLPLLSAVAYSWDHGILDEEPALSLARRLRSLLRLGASDVTPELGAAGALLERAAPSAALNVWRDALEAHAGDVRGVCPAAPEEPARRAALRRWFELQHGDWVSSGEGNACRGLATLRGWVSASALASADRALGEGHAFELDHPAFGRIPAMRYRHDDGYGCAVEILVGEVLGEWRVLEEFMGCMTH
ncbi:MAG: hypothetical protein AAGH15_13425, partial [Myxococcota bacterium]